MKKFTLIELLIVMAIIGILVTILMPSLNKARHKAVQAVCMSNQRQLAGGTAIFAKNNNDRLMYANYFTNEPWRMATPHNNYYLHYNNRQTMNHGYLYKEEIVTSVASIISGEALTVECDPDNSILIGCHISGQAALSLARTKLNCQRLQRLRDL